MLTSGGYHMVWFDMVWQVHLSSWNRVVDFFQHADAVSSSLALDAAETLEVRSAHAPIGT